MNFIVVLIIFFSFFSGIGLNSVLYNKTLSAHFFPKVEKQIEKQINIFENNPINFSLKTEHRFPKPPIRVLQKNIDLSAQSSIAIDLTSNLELFGNNEDKPTSIASITKLMTALIWLDYNPGWNTEYEIKPSDRRVGGRIRLYTGDHLTAKDLFYASLVSSENTAITGLVNLSGLSEKEFVDKMNKKAKELRMYNTKFVDPTGLNPQNVSTARDLFKLAKVALANKDISKAVRTKKYVFYTKENKKKIFLSTDELLGDMPKNTIILGGKTGYLEEGGYCFVGLFSKDGHKIITVVLGAHNRWQRFIQTKKMLNYIFASYLWPQEEKKN